jgi:hypothetical protein
MRLYRACDAGDERGAALVEFALVLPILLLILVAMLDFGKAFNYRIDETHLASSGARWAVVNNGNPSACPDGTTPATLQQYIVCNGDTAEFRSTASAYIRFPNGRTVGRPVQVCVVLPYNWLHFLSTRVTLPQKLAATSTMRLEAVPDATKIPTSPTWPTDCG